MLSCACAQSQKQWRGILAEDDTQKVDEVWPPVTTAKSREIWLVRMLRFSEFSHEVVGNDMLLINRLNDAKCCHEWLNMSWWCHECCHEWLMLPWHDCCYLSYSSVYSLTSLVLAGAIFVHFPFSKPGEFPFAATGSPVCRDDGPRSQAALILFVLLWYGYVIDDDRFLLWYPWCIGICLFFLRFRHDEACKYCIQCVQLYVQHIIYIWYLGLCQWLWTNRRCHDRVTDCVTITLSVEAASEAEDK